MQQQSGMTAPDRVPRVLVISAEQWHRALLRAALRDVGYDAVGAPSVTAALRFRADAAGRGPVRLVVVDQPALGEGDDALARLLARHGAPAALLLARATVGAPAGPWARVLVRPVSVADVVATVEALLPL